ncbi:MAG: ferrous iron transport protein A [Aridibacter famidurans]|nr:ferrous iron transport protein A [Aridibacter famidurans]
MEKIKVLTLADVAAGTKAKVLRVSGSGPVPKRLMEMGIVPGVWIRVVKSAPFGDPIEVRLRGYSLAMRRNEAESIEVTE